ncbi:MAG: hypothetical protein QM589_04465 [Thermomicrobiales bacterium]
MKARRMQESDDENLSFIVDLASGDFVPLRTNDPTSLIVSPASFLPDGSIVSAIFANGVLSLLRSDMDGQEIGVVSLPAGLVRPEDGLAPSVSTDGTVFVPTMGVAGSDFQGGVFVDGASIG